MRCLPDPIGFGASADFPTFTRNTNPYPDRQVGYSGVLDSRYPFDHDLGQADPRMVDRRYRELLPDLGPRGEWPQGNTDYAAAAGRASFGEAMRRIGVGSMGGLPPTRRGEGGHAGGGG